jgi:hypothetical protein
VRVVEVEKVEERRRGGEVWVDIRNLLTKQTDQAGTKSSSDASTQHPIGREKRATGADSSSTIGMQKLGKRLQ